MVHAHAEEESLYVHMKEENDSEDLRVEGYEGDTEHSDEDANDEAKDDDKSKPTESAEVWA